MPSDLRGIGLTRTAIRDVSLGGLLESLEEFVLPFLLDAQSIVLDIYACLLAKLTSYLQRKNML